MNESNITLQTNTTVFVSFMNLKETLNKFSKHIYIYFFLKLMNETNTIYKTTTETRIRIVQSQDRS